MQNIVLICKRKNQSMIKRGDINGEMFKFEGTKSIVIIMFDYEIHLVKNFNRWKNG